VVDAAAIFDSDLPAETIKAVRKGRTLDERVNHGEGWVSATDLAGYAFCPESIRLRQHGFDPGDTEARRKGTEYHQAFAARRFRPAQILYWAIAIAAALAAIAWLRWVA
jgi:hypothetical protein